MVFNPHKIESDLCKFYLCSVGAGLIPIISCIYLKYVHCTLEHILKKGVGVQYQAYFYIHLELGCMKK